VIIGLALLDGVARPGDQARVRSTCSRRTTRCARTAKGGQRCADVKDAKVGYVLDEPFTQPAIRQDETSRRRARPSFAVNNRR